MVILLFLLDPKNRADHGPSSSWSVRSPRRRNNEMTASPTLSSSTYLRRSLSVTPPVERTGRASPSEEWSYTSPHCLAWSLAVAKKPIGTSIMPEVHEMPKSFSVFSMKLLIMALMQAFVLLMNIVLK
jgi:hypothetical protein